MLRIAPVATRGSTENFRTTLRAHHSIRKAEEVCSGWIGTSHRPRPTPAVGISESKHDWTACAGYATSGRLAAVRLHAKAVYATTK